MLPTLPNDARDGESHSRSASMSRATGRNQTSERKAMAKKRAPKRRAWNKGLEVGKRDGFTPDQVKRIRAFSRIVASPGSEIWLSSRWQSTPCCTDKTCSLSLLGMYSVAMVQSGPLLRLHARGECQQCDAPCPRYPQRRLKNGSLRPAKSAPIIYSLAVALRAVIRWVSGN